MQVESKHRQYLESVGVNRNVLEVFFSHIETMNDSIEEKALLWQALVKKIKDLPFEIHLYFFQLLFPHWQLQPETCIAWLPDTNTLHTANLTQWMAKLNITSLAALQHFTVKQFSTFWEQVCEELKIIFKKPPSQTCDLSNGITAPSWFSHAKMNIADSCFTAAPSQTALCYLNTENKLIECSYETLDILSNRIAHGLTLAGFKKGDCIAIIMPMSVEAVAAYLGILKMGGVVASIADSFSATEIATRLKISHAKAIFTQAITSWADKKFNLYEKLHLLRTQDLDPTIFVVGDHALHSVFSLADKDKWFDALLSAETHFESIACDPMDPCNILFSSGTAGEPKAIVWNHTTGIKAASDAFFHHNLKPEDRICWPTNLGWMMGPWLIFAGLINQASIALYTDVPRASAFGQFVQASKVTVLGVVPTLVKAWRDSRCMETFDWQAIKLFSSTGECSNPEDMLYLMSLADYKPIIEYCGGTEIGGAYVSSTVIQPNCPTLFSTPTMGLDFIILDEHGHPASEGEVAIIPPSIGLSTTLINGDHHQLYYENMPTWHGMILRRHGDELKKLTNGYYSIQGRHDDTMNLGGIKTSAIEIERALINTLHIKELAAVAVPPETNGPSLLILFVVTDQPIEKAELKAMLQKRINANLNPLFKIHELIFLDALPRTSSNKIIRRQLKKEWLSLRP